MRARAADPRAAPREVIGLVRGRATLICTAPGERGKGDRDATERSALANGWETSGRGPSAQLAAAGSGWSASGPSDVPMGSEKLRTEEAIRRAEHDAHAASPAALDEL